MITKEAKAGTLQSNDCMVKVKPYESLKIEIKSILYEEFGETIKKLAENTLENLNENRIFIEVEDRAAPDSTIKRRIEEAVERAK